LSYARYGHIFGLDGKLLLFTGKQRFNLPTSY